MVASALFGLPCVDEGSHGLEDSVGASEVLIEKVFVM
jgi:hypothetical protein